MKKQLPKFNEIDLKVLFEAMKKSYKNAEDYYYYEADFCYQIRSYGHSQAFSILGIEEIGKACGYLRLLFLKMLPESLRKKSGYNPDTIIKNIHSKHDVKLMLSFDFSILSDAFFDALPDVLTISEELEEELESTPISSVRDAMSRVRDATLNMDREIQKKVEQKFRNKKQLENKMIIENLQRDKELGMYVEIEDEPTRVSYPRRMKAKTPKRCLSILDRYLDLFSYIPEVQWDEIEKLSVDIKFVIKHA